MPDTTQVLTDVQDGVQTITLNQPAKFNALSSDMLAGLAEAMRGAERDAAVRAIVLTGAGKAFSSGADLTDADLTDCDLFQAILDGAKLSGADLTGAEVSGLCLTTLADFAGLRISDDQMFRLLDAIGVSVRVRQR